MTKKPELRQSLNAKRQSLSPQHISHAAIQICTQIQNTQLLETPTHIATYYAMRSECDPAPLVNVLWKQGKQIYLPCLEDNTLTFVHYSNNTTLLENRYGIPEPNHREGAIALHKLDCILLPLLGFDKKGNRLGMGAGYYDRTLAKLEGHTHRPILIGLAFDWQCVDTIPTDPWDWPLDAVITDHRVYQFT